MARKYHDTTEGLQDCTYEVRNLTEGKKGLRNTNETSNTLISSKTTNERINKQNSACARNDVSTGENERALTEDKEIAATERVKKEKKEGRKRRMEMVI